MRLVGGAVLVVAVSFAACDHTAAGKSAGGGSDGGPGGGSSSPSSVHPDLGAAMVSVLDGGAPDTQPTPLPDGGVAGVVSYVGVTSDKVADVSSLEAWQRSFITAGMSDADKAQAVWKSVVSFRHQDEPAREFLESTAHTHDPIKLFNVYGYSQCDCASAAVAALGRSVGLGARGQSLTSHSVAELSFGGGWHMFDAAYIDQFPQPDGSLAAVDDLVQAVTSWLAANPNIDPTDHDALERFMANGGYKRGPALLAACPYYDANGLFPARVQGWADSVQDYREPASETEFGYTLGYRVNVQLRQGEKLTRNWSNVGHQLNDDLGIVCVSVDDVPGQGDMCYSPGYGDLAPGRVGNGSFAWTLPLDGGAYRAGALAVTNVADAAAGDSGARVHVADGSMPGVLVVRMPSSYVYLSGSMNVSVEVGGGGKVVVELSRNQGLDWTPVATETASGAYTIDLSSLVRRLYDYRLRFTLTGAGTGLDAVSVDNEIQYSQRALPALAQGDNHIRFVAGASEGTITFDGNTDATVTQNLTWKDLHPTIDSIADAPLRPTAGAGAVTFPVTTPGDLVRLRFGTFYRARGAGDAWDYQVSFDGGKSFTTVEHAAGPTVGAEDFVTVANVPAGTRSALVRFSGTQEVALNIFDFRIDADYKEPAGGFAPITITYSWDENGQTKSDVHQANSPDDSWVIHCDGTPRMRSIIVERAQ